MPLLLLSACGGDSDPADAAESTPTPTEAEPADTATEEATEAGEETEAMQWGDGVWPEGYSFDLPDGVILRSLDSEPEELGYGLVGPPYRPIMLAPGSPLLDPPEPLDGGWIDEWDLKNGLTIGAEYLLEQFLDSDLLFRTYTREAEQEWFAGFTDRMTPELQEQAAALADEPLARHSFPITLGSGLTSVVW